MVPIKNGGKKGHSAISEVGTPEHIINIHKSIHGVGFKKPLGHPRRPRKLP